MKSLLKKKRKSKKKSVSISSDKKKGMTKCSAEIKTSKTIWVGSPTEPFVDKYSRGPQLGHGGGEFGVTYKCWKHEDDDVKSGGGDGASTAPNDSKCVAVKYMNKTRCYRIAEKYRKRILAQMQDEIGILRTLRHKNIVDLIDIFEDKSTLYLAMKLCTGGDLFTGISEKKHFNEEDAARIAKQIFEALLYMQDVHTVAHCHLKPGNIMFEDKTDEANVKVCVSWLYFNWCLC